MTEIYLHIDARIADYIRTHPYVPHLASAPVDKELLLGHGVDVHVPGTTTSATVTAAVHTANPPMRSVAPRHRCCHRGAVLLLLTCAPRALPLRGGPRRSNSATTAAAAAAVFVAVMVSVSGVVESVVGVGMAAAAPAAR